MNYLNKVSKATFFRIIKSMFSKAKYCGKWNSLVDDMFTNLCGVLHGGVISATLFKLFVEDKFEYFSHDHGINLGPYTSFIPRLLFKIFDTQIQSIIDYGCKVWYIGLTIDEIEMSACHIWHRTWKFKYKRPLLQSMEKRGESHLCLDSKKCFSNSSSKPILLYSGRVPPLLGQQEMLLANRFYFTLASKSNINIRFCPPE